MDGREVQTQLRLARKSGANFIGNNRPNQVNLGDCDNALKDKVIKAKANAARAVNSQIKTNFGRVPLFSRFRLETLRQSRLWNWSARRDEGKNRTFQAVSHIPI